MSLCVRLSRSRRHCTYCVQLCTVYSTRLSASLSASCRHRSEANRIASHRCLVCTMMAAAWHRNSALSGASPHQSLQAARRIRQHIQQYQSTQLNLHTHIGAASARSLSSTSAPRDGVSIGDVFVPLNSPHRLTRSDLIPCGYRSKDIASDSQETLTHIKWMMQKERHTRMHTHTHTHAQQEHTRTHEWHAYDSVDPHRK